MQCGKPCSDGMAIHFQSQDRMGLGQAAAAYTNIPVVVFQIKRGQCFKGRRADISAPDFWQGAKLTGCEVPKDENSTAEVAFEIGSS
jgi:hypothetical protein